MATLKIKPYAEELITPAIKKGYLISVESYGDNILEDLGKDELSQDIDEVLEAIKAVDECCIYLWKSKEDYKERDDNNWLVHSLAWLNDKGDVSMGSRGVHMNTLTNHVQPIPPKRRVY